MRSKRCVVDGKARSSISSSKSRKIKQNIKYPRAHLTITWSSNFRSRSKVN